MNIPAPNPHSEARRRTSVIAWTLGSLLFLVAWDQTPLDLWMAHLFGSASGFALQDHWFWSGLLHDRIRPYPWLVEIALLAAVALPFGKLAQLPVERRLQLALTTLVSLLVVSTLKLHSRSSCPWELQEFGGVASYLSHWAWSGDGGSGQCFPAGHASAGFAFLGGYFAFRHILPVTARRWLAGAMAAGLVLGLAQQVRGAHFMSHTLWTGWLCWTCAALIDGIVSESISQRPSPARAQVPDLSARRPSMQSA
jgi:membrane-associated PAP2 superfamily phosphatase